MAVLGSFFVYQLDINYLWLSALLTVAAIVLGIMVLIRYAKFKESRLVLFGTISGLVVVAVQVLLLVSSALFFNQVRDYQQCSRQALTQQAASKCQTQLENRCPGSAKRGAADAVPLTRPRHRDAGSRSASRSFCWRSSHGPAA